LILEYLEKMATTMAAARQPFAPLNGSRLQNLTSLKNRQNGMLALAAPPPINH
jgi:hypothetical protein